MNTNTTVSLQGGDSQRLTISPDRYAKDGTVTLPPLTITPKHPGAFGIRVSVSATGSTGETTDGKPDWNWDTDAARPHLQPDAPG